MFQINGKPCKVDTYCVTKKWDGYNTLEFDVSQNDPLFPLCAEYTDVVERQKYYISKVDGSRTVHVQCSLDLRDFEGIAVDNYDNTSATLATTMAAALPSGWSFVNAAGSTVYRTVTVQYGTALDIIDSCRTLYGVGFVFDTVAKTVTAVNPGGYTQGPAFITEQLNLRRLQYYGDGSGIITRLKARGKDGLTFSDINGGKDYVENYGYSSKIVYGWFVDERYTSKENLLAAATTKLAELSKPMRSYECDVVDLKAINPEKYTAQDLDIYKIIALKDMSRKTEHTYQVVERREYPHYPEKNVVTLATKAPDLTRRFQELESEISELGLQDDNGWITGDDGGYLYMVRNASGQPTALVFMNALTQAQSTKAGRIDQSGIKYGPTGAMGNFVQMFDIASCVWKSANYTEDGSGNCTAGTMINLTTGEVKSKKFKIDTAGSLEITGKVTADSGKVGGWTIAQNALATAGNVLYLGTAAISKTINGQNRSVVFSAGAKFGVAADGTLYAKDAKIAGEITADSGEIGGFTISASGLSGNTCGLYSGVSGGRLQLGNVSITGNAAFELSTGADIAGIVEAQAFHAQEEVICGDLACDNLYVEGSFSASSFNPSSMSVSGNITAGTLNSDNGIAAESYVRAGTYVQVGTMGYESGTDYPVYWGSNSKKLLRKSSSSKRYKRDIEYLDIAAYDDVFSACGAVKFRYKDREYEDGKYEYGLIAEDVYEKWPHAIIYKKTDNGRIVDGIDYAMLTVPLIIECQNLRKTIKKLDERIAGLEAKLCSK